jgi:hypothetical protein
MRDSISVSRVLIKEMLRLVCFEKSASSDF